VSEVVLQRGTTADWLHVGIEGLSKTNYTYTLIYFQPSVLCMALHFKSSWFVFTKIYGWEELYSFELASMYVGTYNNSAFIILVS